MVRLLALPLLLCALAWPGFAHAAACTGTWPVGERTLSLADGREVAVWYPAVRKPSPSDAPADDVTADAPIATCAARFPLVLFSHGFAGCNEQAVYITAEIARHGYVVAAPNHRDAICKAPGLHGLPVPAGSDRPSFLLPRQWSSASWRGRMLDLRETLRLVQTDPALGRAVNADDIGLMGHSLGGYTVLGMVGGWPDWKLHGVRAVLAFAPYAQPLLDQRRLRDLRVPVMYQVGEYDFGISPTIVRSGGAYDASPAPKYLVELAGATHLAWTDWSCIGQTSVARCVAGNATARWVDAYAIAFLDRYLKGARVPLLDGKGEGLAKYRGREH